MNLRDRDDTAMKLQPDSSFPFFTPAIWGTLFLTVFSGIFMAVYYVPSLAQAFSSVERLNDQVPFGWMIRRLHGAGGNFLLILLFVRLLWVFCKGEYKAGPRTAWGIGIFSLFLTIWANFSGFFLVLSQSAFWGTASVLSNISLIPWVGSLTVDFLRGGKELGGVALSRFYSMHIGFSALGAWLLFRLWHQQQKIIGKDTEEREAVRFRAGLFTAATAGAILTAVTFGPDWFSDPLREAANPMVNPDRFSPPWYFLFLEEAFKFITATYPALSLAALIVFAILLVSLPYIDRNPERNLLLRPASLSLGAALLVAFVYFSLLGAADANYGEKIVLPERNFSSSEIRGARVFAEKNCAYCHQVFGHGGRREGPDMAVVKQRLRSPDWVKRFILNGRLYQAGTTMPRYDIPLNDLEALSAYLLSLDPTKRTFRAVERGRLLDYELTQ